MEQLTVSLPLLAVLISCLTAGTAELGVSLQEDVKAQNPVDAAQSSDSKSLREGALDDELNLLKERLHVFYFTLKEEFKEGDALLKERVAQIKEMVEVADGRLKEELDMIYNTLKEQLREGDTLLNERVMEENAQIKKKVKVGDRRLKRNLAGLKKRMDKQNTRLQREIDQEQKRISDEMAEQREIIAKLQNSVKMLTESSSGLPDSLQQQMSDMQSQLTSTRQLLDTTRAQLTATQEQLQATQDQARTTQEQLITTQEQLSTTRDILTAVQERSRLTEGELKATKKQAFSTQEQLKATLRTLADVQRNASVEGSKLRAAEVTLDDVQRKVLLTQDQLQQWREEESGDVGSVFTRWGRATCPQNTSLVYSGWAGGSYWNHTGGGSNYLCLVQDPQLDNTTARPSYYSYLYGAHYRHIPGHDEEDVVCSVCRAPQATTLMIPATLSCPPDWTTQYRGHIMTAYYNSHRQEYVCVDDAMENRPGGEAGRDAASFFQVVIDCGSLPCPPYVHRKLLVTCVVCSL